MKRLELLEQRQVRLKRQIAQNLDLLVGTVAKSPAMRQYNLTTKIDGKTVTRYVRNGLVAAARKMTLRHRKVRRLIQKLSKVNWELLRLRSR